MSNAYDFLIKEIKKDDLVLVLGAGDIYKIADSLAEVNLFEKVS